METNHPNLLPPNQNIENQNLENNDNLDLPSQGEVEKIEKPTDSNETEDLGAPSFDAPAPCFQPGPK